MHLHLRHLFQVSLVGIIDVVEDQIPWGPCTTIVEEGLKVVVEVTTIDEAYVLVQAQLDLAARHEADDQKTCCNGEDDELTDFVEHKGHKILGKEGADHLLSWDLFLF